MNHWSWSLLILGFGCSSDKGVTIHNSAPAAAILGPVDGTLFEADETINFEGVVGDAQTDPEYLTITWATNQSGILPGEVTADVDGMVFYPTTLTPGAHIVTLQVIDEGGKRASDTISVEVINADDPPVLESIEHPSSEESDTAQEGVEYEFEAIVSDPQDNAYDLIVTVSIEENMEDGSTEYEELCTAIPEASGLAKCSASMERGMKMIQFAVEDTDGNITTGRAELDVIPLTDTDDDGDGYSESDGDCDDTDEDIHPGAFEIYNNADDDCDGIIDDNTMNYDDDGDGHTELGGDCDDTDDRIYPGASEECDGIDNDCDGLIDGEGTPGVTEYFLDADNDGFGDPEESTWLCDFEPTDGYVVDNTDCDDLDDTVHPDAIEQCDGFDNNCDDLIDGADADTAVTTYRDLDADGFGDASFPDTRCIPLDGYISDNTDCDDTNEAAYPGATEVCDGFDNSCDGTVDEEDATGCFTYYRDADRDSYGSTESACLCDPVGDFTSTTSTDCYDGNPSAKPVTTPFFTEDRGDGSFDYNCTARPDYDGIERENVESSSPCGFFADGLGCGATEGWRGSAPECGEDGTWNYDCHQEWDWFDSGCYWRERPETQACR